MLRIRQESIHIQRDSQAVKRQNIKNISRYEIRTALLYWFARMEPEG